MLETLSIIEDEALEALRRVANVEEYERLRLYYLGKKGLVTEQVKTISSLPVEERKNYGARLNNLKASITQALETTKTRLEKHMLEMRIQSESYDISLPLRPEEKGSLHPIMQVQEEAFAILGEMGFELIEGPEIEDDFHNFTALNIPEHHPARQMQDTFYIKGKDKEDKPLLLRTHTSNVQIRYLEKNPGPCRIMSSGRVYRSDSDATHTPMFHQLEGLYIDKKVHMGHLKTCIYSFLERFFSISPLPLRFRSSFFPFTEPSAEVDIQCERGKDYLTLGQGKDWLEILGCGMVHPHVLRNVGMDPEEYQGFAFGIGIERITMLKYNVADLRSFFDAGLSWSAHYGALPFDIPHSWYRS